ncbi:MAG: glycosyltransferase family 2 protein [Acidaminococcaceae bacterium]
MFFSIIVCVYNTEAYLDKCLQSVLQQPFTDFEVILIDDGSQDKSGEICEKYAQLDKRIRLIHQKNQGVPATRNIALAMASGAYIIWVDSDDWIEKGLLSDVKKTIDQTSADIIIFDFCVVGNAKCEKHALKYHEGLLNKQEAMSALALDEELQSYLWNKAFKRSLFEGICFPAVYRIMEDYSIMHILFHRAAIFYYMPRLLYYYFERPGSVSRTAGYDGQKEHDKIQITLQRMGFLNENYPAISQADSLIAPIHHSMNTLLRGDYLDEGLQTILKFMRKNLWGLLFTNKLSCKEKRDVLFIVTNPASYRKYKLRKKLKF